LSKGEEALNISLNIKDEIVSAGFSFGGLPFARYYHSLRQSCHGAIAGSQMTDVVDGLGNPQLSRRFG
jgi:hypothetical protein